MQGYLYWAERQRLLTWFKDEKLRAGLLPDDERAKREQAVERELLVKMEALYGQISSELEAAKA